MVFKIYGLYREDENHITDEWNGLFQTNQVNSSKSTIRPGLTADILK